MSNQYHPFVWTPTSGMVDFTLNGPYWYYYDYVSWITESGFVVGSASTPASFVQHALVWSSATGLVDLTLGDENTWSQPYAVSDNGTVVGYSSLTSGNYHGFVWTPAGGIVDGVRGPVHSPKPL